MEINLSLNEKIKNNVTKIKEIYHTVQNNTDHYVDHIIYNAANLIDENTVSIVMTSHNRIKQTLFTLDTIETSSYKNVQVIIIEDSTNGFIGNLLNKYPFRIDYIKIKAANRDWVNPCVNYNIGFKYIKGNYIIIQNAEVCHIGDIVKYTRMKLTEGNYFVFDVISTCSYNNNNSLYDVFKNNTFDREDIRNLITQPDFYWFQHSDHRPANLHFLTAIHINDFKKMECSFDYDFSLGRHYDDNEFIVRIRFLLRLNLSNVEFSKTNLLGIHQHHETVMLNASEEEYRDSIALNRYIFKKRKNF